jgi:hypothetical protein
LSFSKESTLEVQAKAKTFMRAAAAVFLSCLPCSSTIFMQLRLKHGNFGKSFFIINFQLKVQKIVQQTNIALFGGKYDCHKRGVRGKAEQRMAHVLS